MFEKFSKLGRPMYRDCLSDIQLKAMFHCSKVFQNAPSISSLDLFSPRGVLFGNFSLILLDQVMSV
jgi:hypothetical protein